MRKLLQFELTQEDIDILKKASFILNGISMETGRNLWTEDDLYNIGNMAKGIETPKSYRLNATQGMNADLFTFKDLSADAERSER